MQTRATSIDTTTAKELVDEYLRTYCQNRLGDAAKLGPSYELLWRSIEKLLLAGGKRLRPFMVLLAYGTYRPDGNPTDILPAAIAQELLHCAMLIHDDIIDRDTIRYGIKNIAGQYNEHYRTFIEDGNERSHLSLSAALLAGDILIADAHREFNRLNSPSVLANRAEDILSSSIFEVIGGELLDSEVAFLPVGSISAKTIARFKTASYSFIGPLTTGAVLAEAPEQDVKTLRELSEILGIGYQLRDDLLGVFGDTVTTGKSTTTDIVEGKRTYLIEQFERLATAEQAEQFKAVFHKPDLNAEENLLARKMLVDSGAKAAVENEITRIRGQASEKIASLSLPDESKALYQSLVERCLDREA